MHSKTFKSKMPKNKEMPSFQSYVFLPYHWNTQNNTFRRLTVNLHQIFTSFLSNSTVLWITSKITQNQRYWITPLNFPDIFAPLITNQVISCMNWYWLKDSDLSFLQLNLDKCLHPFSVIKFPSWIINAGRR